LFPSFNKKSGEYYLWCEAHYVSLGKKFSDEKGQGAEINRVLIMSIRFAACRLFQWCHRRPPMLGLMLSGKLGILKR